MKVVDLAPLKSIDTEYEKVYDTVSENYKGDWDDKIHDSYLRYLKQVHENSRKIHVIRCKAETLEKELYGLRVDELKKMSEILCREADSV